MEETNPYITPRSADESALRSSVSHEKLFSLGAVVLATFLGSFPAGGLLMAKNYWRTKKSSYAWATLLGAIALTAVTFTAGYFLPGETPSSAILIPQLAAAYLISKALQGEMLERHVAKGGHFCSKWAAAGWGMLCGTVLLSLIFVAILFFDIG